MNFQSALANIDSYKLGHGDQYPPGTTKEEAAGGELRTVFLDGKIAVDEDYATIRRRLGYIA